MTKAKWDWETHLDVDEHAVIRLIQDFVALPVQRKFKRNLSLATGELPRLHHFNGAVDDLDGLQRDIRSVTVMNVQSPFQSRVS